jgi:hypothetical protein
MKPLTPLLLALLFCGCSAPECVQRSEFKKQYAEIGMPQSMYSVRYLGRRNGRAEIKRSFMSTASRTWSDHVISGEPTELDATFRDSLPKTEMRDSK